MEADALTDAEVTGPMGQLYTTTPCCRQRAVFKHGPVVGLMRRCKVDGRRWEVLTTELDASGDGSVSWVEVD